MSALQSLPITEMLQRGSILDVDVLRLKSAFHTDGSISADEAEANCVGWLTCRRADAPSQDSGWLYLYWQSAGELPGPRSR